MIALILALSVWLVLAISLTMPASRGSGRTGNDRYSLRRTR